MKKILYTIAFLAAGIQLVFAQQRPQYTQYIFNNYLLNPALTGIENYSDVKLGYRSQWTGLEGAPVTAYLTVNTPFGNKFLKADSASNLSGKQYMQQYKAAEPHHGIGLTIVSDKTGPITQTNIDATYAYHLSLTSTLNLAVGVSAGLRHNSLNFSLLHFGGIDDGDMVLNSINNNQWKPDLGLGVWAYSSNYFIGLSVQQLISQNFYTTTSVNTSRYKTTPHYFFTAGTKLFLSDNIAIIPSFLVKVIQPIPTTFDLNMKLLFEDKFWIGGSYRRDDSFAALTGFNLNSFVNVGYSYDFTNSALKSVSNGSHQIVVGILLNNHDKTASPHHTF
ncbi:type IX secretion system membrane protein PorP/SprF [Mucilaginibacter sp. Mucisp84]|uniref:PorP/SprF family type IX secretion system membrane protein n=1 Tax=Mucilaginibacter sp. Mucisp84 TaxID=3243058 RepID=UPI0039A51E45